MKRAAAVALCCGLLLPWPAGAAEFELRGLFDLRAVAGFDGVSWLDRGLDRARFSDGDGPLVWGSGLLDLDARLVPTVSFRLSLAGYDTTDREVDWTEAFLDYSPVPRSVWRWRIRAGAFYPPVSLENTAVGWTSPYTLSFSAIDTWVGEEVRMLGVEGSATRMGKFTGSASDWTLVGAAVRSNDPLGALLSWRGFAVHDRQTGWRERLPLAPLPFFDLEFIPQEAWEEPFKEIDGRTGYYVGVGRDGPRSRLRLLRYDNLANPAIAEGGQWAWRTRFDHLGWQLAPREGCTLLAQALHGDTEMDGFTGPLVYARFDAAYLLWSRAWSSHRLSARADFWSVLDDDSTPKDPNQEHGHSWTAAYFYEPEPGSRFGGWRAGLEVRFLTSDRPARRLLGADAHRNEATAELSAQWRF